MSQLTDQIDNPVSMQLRIQRTAEPGIIMAIAWEGGFMTPGQGWSPRFVQWADLRGHLLETVNISRNTLDLAEKCFRVGYNFDIPMITHASQLQKMGFERQTASLPVALRHSILALQSMKLHIVNNKLKHRFETEIGPRTAFLNYILADKVITFTHTEVPSSLNGRGIGTALVKAGLDYAIEQSLRVVPQCPFVADFISAHPHYQSIVNSQT
jgi:uncharacterized protein